jgi:hypothetical protein
MISRTSLLAGTAAAGMFAAIQSARADLIYWTLSGDYNDGGTFSGDFTYDNVADVITLWNLSTTSGSAGVGPNTYSSPTGGASANGSEVLFTNFLGSFGPISYGVYAEFDDLAPGTPGIIASLTGEEYDMSCFLTCGVTDSRSITSGTAVGTDISAPEPASGTLVLAGIGLLGVYRRRRRGL